MKSPICEDQKPLFTENLTASENLESVKKTYLGQAHFAGTGPKGKTCRECARWALRFDGYGRKICPPYKGRPDTPKIMHLQEGRCNHGIPNKADRLFPPTAAACRLFEPTDDVFPLTRRDKRFKKEAG